MWGRVRRLLLLLDVVSSWCSLLVLHVLLLVRWLHASAPVAGAAAATAVAAGATLRWPRLIMLLPRWCDSAAAFAAAAC